METRYELLSQLAVKENDSGQDQDRTSGAIHRYNWLELGPDFEHGDGCNCTAWMSTDARGLRIEGQELEQPIVSEGTMATLYSGPPSEKTTLASHVLLHEECIGERVYDPSEIEEVEEVWSCNTRIRQGEVYQYNPCDNHAEECGEDHGSHDCPCLASMECIEEVRVLNFHENNTAARIEDKVKYGIKGEVIKSDRKKWWKPGYEIKIEPHCLTSM